MYSQLILLAMQDRPFPYKLLQEISNGCTEICKKRTKGVPDFSDISANDQMKLISANVPLLHVFQEAGNIDCPDSGLNKGQLFLVAGLQVCFMKDFSGGVGG